MNEMIERAEKLAKSINEAHWCTDGLSFEDVVSRLIIRELQEDEKRIKELEKEKALLVLEVHNKNKRIAELKAEVDQAVERKNRQFKEYLEKKRDALTVISRLDFYDISNAFGGVKYLDEIINELFKKEE